MRENLNKLAPYGTTAENAMQKQKDALDNNTIALLALTEALATDSNGDLTGMSITLGNKNYNWNGQEWDIAANTD